MSEAAPVDLTRFRSALVVKPSSLGDIVHTLPAVHRIKRAFPHLQMRWLLNPEWIPLVEGNPDITQVIPFPRGEFRGPRSLPALLRWLRQFNHADRPVPEVALDFQGLLRSSLLSLIRGADAIVGMSDAREGAPFFYKHIVPVASSDHAVERSLAFARALGAAEDSAPEFLLPPGEWSLQPLPRRFVLLHPYSRGHGKSMREDALRSLCECLAPHTVVIVGRAENAAPPAAPHIISLLNQTSLLQLLWLARRASACISSDSGPMHIAAAVQPERTLGIHTWSDPRRVGPYDPRALVWKAGRIAHRTEFNDAEARTNAPFGPPEARRLADFVLQHWI
jgi:ADP-heptose:LPS heptosyltransferase